MLRDQAPPRAAGFFCMADASGHGKLSSACKSCEDVIFRKSRTSWNGRKSEERKRIAVSPREASFVFKRRCVRAWVSVVRVCATVRARDAPTLALQSYAEKQRENSTQHLYCFVVVALECSSRRALASFLRPLPSSQPLVSATPRWLSRAAEVGEGQDRFNFFCCEILVISRSYLLGGRHGRGGSPSPSAIALLPNAGKNSSVTSESAHTQVCVIDNASSLGRRGVNLGPDRCDDN